MIFCSVSLFSVVAILFSDVVDEKQKPVGDIHLADTAVKVQRYYIYLRIQRLQPIFDDLLRDVVGYAAERLKANEVPHTLTGECTDFTGN